MKKNYQTCFGDTVTAQTQSTPKNKSRLSTLLACLFIMFIAASPALQAQSISGNSVVCANSSQMYSVPYTSGYTYLWNVTGVSANTANSNSLAVTFGAPPSSGNVTITLFVYDNNGSPVAGSPSLVVWVNPLPQPEVVPENANGCSYQIQRIRDGRPVVQDSIDNCYLVCDSTIYRYKVGQFLAGHVYNWSVIPVSAAIGLTANPSTGEVDVQWGAPSGQITLRLSETDPITGCSDSVDVCLRIIARPQASFSTFPAPDGSGTVYICYNSTVAFFDQSTADVNSTIASWLWDFGDGTYSTQQFPTHTYSSAGTFIAKLIVENQCHCKDSMEITIEVDGQPGADIYCVSPLCYNSYDTYCTDYYNTTCTQLQWTVTNGTITSAGGGLNTACIDVAWGTNAPGSIVLQPDLSCGGCPYPTSVLVPILTPTTTITGANPACENATTFYNVPNVPATSYSWQILPASSGTILSGQGTHNISVFWGQATTVNSVIVTYSNPFLGCSGSAVVEVKVTQKLIITGDEQVCEGSQGNYVSNSSSADWWVEDPTGGTVTIASGANNASYTFPTAGAYVIFAQDLTGNYCSTPRAFQVQVVARPPQVTANITPTLCPGGTNLYTGVPTSNNYYLRWQITNGQPSSANGNAVSVLWNSSGSAWSIALSQVGIFPPSCESVPTIYNITPPALPPPVINGNTSLCFNQSTSYSTPSAVDGYTWTLVPSTLGSIISGAGSDNINVQFNNAPSSSPAVVTLSLQIAQCGTTNVSAITITLTPPTAPSIIVPTDICENQPVVFSASPPVAGTYAWDFGNGSTASGVSLTSTTTVYTSVSPHTVSLTVTNPNGCVGTVTTNTIINVKPTPLAHITSPQILSGGCPSIQPFPYTLYAAAQTITGTPVYVWSVPPSYIPTTGGNSINTSDTGVHSMSVTINGCTAVTAVNVSTNCTSSSGCGGGTVSITRTLSCTTATFGGTASGIGTIINWVFPDASNSTLPNPTYTFPMSGFYHVLVTAQWGTCTEEFDYVIEVPVQADFKYDLNCGSPNLDVSFIDQSNWTPPTSPTFSWSVTSSSPTYANSSSNQDQIWGLLGGTYLVQHTITGGGTSCVATKTIVIPQRPAAGFTVPSGMCEGNPVIFNNTSSPTLGITQYLWDFGDGSDLLTQNPTPNGVRTYNFSGGLNPNVYLTITDIYGCQVVSSSSLITIYQNMFNVNPNAAVITPSFVQICDGTTATLTAGSSNPNSPFTYTWSNFASTSSISVSQAGTYSVQLTDNFGCRSNRASAQVQVIIVPAPEIGGNLSYCFGDMPLLSINRGTGYTYQWIYSQAFPSNLLYSPYYGTFTTSACTSPLFPPPSGVCSAMTPGYFAGGTGTLSLQGLITETSSTLSCKALGSPVTITVHPSPAMPVVGTDICETGNFINLTATPSGTYSSIVWNTGQQGTSINVIPAGAYWASVIDEFGCASLADTAHVWALPDFNSLIYGCYDICDTGTTIIPVPDDYSYYEWKKTGFGIVASGSTNTPLILTNPSTMPGGTNAGEYQLTLTTGHGCTDTSKPIELNVVPCPTCQDMIVEINQLICSPDGGYDFQFAVFYYGGSPANVTITAGSGALSLTPPVTMLNPGMNIISGNFIPTYGVTQLCLHFSIADDDATDAPCGWDYCVDLLPCGITQTCNIEWQNFITDCMGLDANGNPRYHYHVDFFAPFSGTMHISTAQGNISPNSFIFTAGWNSISGTFTDTPTPDAVLCIDAYLQYEDDDGNLQWCYSQVCVTLIVMQPCSQNLPNCNLNIQPQTSVCYSVNSLGQVYYEVSYDINNPSGATYTYYLISSQGIVGGLSSNVINPGGTTYTASFLQIPYDAANPPQCFTLVATNVATHAKCRRIFCVHPQPCDQDQLRLISTAEVNLYPNPTEDYTIAEYTLDNVMEANRLCIIDLNGRIIQEIPLNTTKGKVEINTSSLPAGMYFLKAINGSQTVLVKKLIIQR
ncbi:MAG: PKD domain-containing protein [Bacteroidetes bacterium]|nr:PKD domain-containing protein [Bacteroidota bacterium]